MATKLITHKVTGAPASVNVATAVLAGVQTVYPSAIAADVALYADLVDISAAPGGGFTNLTLRVTYPG